MPRTKKGTPPSYRRHTKGQAVVTVRDQAGRRRDILLGRWDSPESRAEYARVLTVLNQHGGRSPAAAAVFQSLSVHEVTEASWWRPCSPAGGGRKTRIPLISFPGRH